MEYQYLMGGGIMTLLFVLSYRLKRETRASVENARDEVLQNSENGISQSEKAMNTDIKLLLEQIVQKIAMLNSIRLEEGTVTSLLEVKRDIKGVQYKTKNGEELTACAPLTIVSHGCFSNLRLHVTPSTSKFKSFIGLEVDIPSSFAALILGNCELPFPNHGHVILADPSSILFYRISSSEICCLVDVPAGQKLPSISNGEMANYLKSVVAHQAFKVGLAY
ncbi:squalene monooxygenase, putative [Ricinus communis]|uniref:Squalene monooxygenase n=1 Tax=Ricinus communis TaxID=3988 RepID=B9S7T0_RICCO|nr:squalene monooxygenase, putative [Ricinus communis]